MNDLIPRGYGGVQPVLEVTPARIKENFELFDFQLEHGDSEKIDALDRGEAGRDGPNPDMFAYVPG